MIKREDLYRIGRIGRTHGVNGELNLMFIDDAFIREKAEYLFIEIDGIFVPFFIEDCRIKTGSTGLIKFADVNTLTSAHSLTGCDVFCPRHSSNDEKEPPSDAELVGFEVQDESFGGSIGTLSAIDDSTDNMLFEVLDKDGNTILLPAASEMITDIDAVKKLIKMRLPDGILDLNKKKN